jgi:hypothetical protein
MARTWSGGLAGAVVLAAALGIGAGWAACGGSGGTDEGCNPPCGINEVCVDGLCITPDGGTDAPDTPDTAEAMDTTEATDTADVSEFVPVDGTEAGDEGGRSDVDATGFNIGGACTTATDCVGPGEVTCMTEIVVFGRPWEWANGYCSASCDVADPGSCGPDNVCVSISFIGWVGCLQGCTPGEPGQCRESEGYSCLDSASIPGGFIPAPICAPTLF